MGNAVTVRSVGGACGRAARSPTAMIGEKAPLSAGAADVGLHRIAQFKLGVLRPQQGAESGERPFGHGDRAANPRQLVVVLDHPHPFHAVGDALPLDRRQARFDEDSNIRWSRDLEDAGVQVFHGLVGLKTHCKLSLLVRRDPDGLTRRYAHLGTGNYNTTTARIYTDLSLLTADPEITSAIHDVFSFLTAYAEHPSYDPLMVAPLNLAEHFLALIAREAEHARHGRPARIIAKMNALLDKNVIMALYRASQAGVEIDLIVRGICALRPGVRGVSDHIRVRSIVGRFLEHSRIFHFANGGQEEVYLGSADWMPRNLYERVEVVFPIKDELLRERVRQEILEACLSDNAKSRLLQRNGAYVRAWKAQGKRHAPLGAAAFNAQDFLIGLAEGKMTMDAMPAPAPQRKRRITAERVR